MKVFYLTILFFSIMVFGSSIYSFGQSEWIKQISGTTNDLWSVHLTDTLAGTAVGANGTIIRTTNGGIKWEPQVSNTSELLYGVTFVSKDKGTIVGSKGTILQTENGGESWVTRSSGTMLDLHSISFASENIGVIAGGNGGSAVVLRTEDGGLTWFSQNIPTTIPLWGASLIDDKTCCLVGEYSPGGTILYTSDGGANWVSQSAGIYTDEMYNVEFISKTKGMAVGLFATVIATNDGGTNWFNLSVPFEHYYNLTFTNENNITVVGSQGKIISTIDGGTNWKEETTNTYSNLMGICTIDKSHLAAVGSNGTILAKGGMVQEPQDWVEISSPSERGVKKILCHNQKIYAGTDSDGVFVSPDYGASWYQINNGLTSKNIVKLIENDNNICVITVDENYKDDLYLLSDTSNYWEKINIDSNKIFSVYSAFCTVTDSIFLLAASQSIWKTSDRGQFWKKIPINTYASINFFKYVKQIDRVFISSYNTEHSGDIYITMVQTYYSSDKGEIWSPINSLSHSSPLNDIKYISINRLLASTFGSGVFSSSDLGNSWILHNSGLNEISASNLSNYGTKIFVNNGPYKFSSGYSIYISDNEGENWSLKGSIPTSLQSFTTSFVNGNYYFAFSAGGTIMRIPIGMLTKVEQQEQKISKYFLQQNYPNPFNPSTTISYEISKSELVTIKIYDVLGREIETLVNEEKSPGKYKIEFDGSNLTSGVYFYKITTNNFSETKKMLLMK